MTEPLSDSQIIEDFSTYCSAPLANLLKFIGFDSSEAFARDCLFTDSNGTEYLDCLGGYGTMSVGHSHPHVVARVKEQLDKNAMWSRVFFNAPQAALAKRLAELTPGELQHSFFCNSGTEAAEAGIKIARAATGRTKLVSTIGAYHGKTMGALSVSGREKYQKPFVPLVPNCVRVPYNDIRVLEETIDDETAAFLVEPIQGEGGIIVPSDEYLRAAREICDQHGALLVFDEVQTGLGRTGKMWGCNWADVAPDMMFLAKALSGGCVPIGAVVAHPKTWHIWNENPFIHSSTFGGNPLACTAGLATLEVIENENLVEKSRVQGEKLMARLRETQGAFPHCMKEVRGRGLMIGFEFTHEDIGGLAIAGLAQRRVLAAYSLNNPKVMRFAPPLTISDEQIEWAATAFHEAVEQTAMLIEGMDIEDDSPDETSPELDTPAPVI